TLDLGPRRLTHLALPGPGGACSAYVLHDAQGVRLCFSGDAVPPGAAGTADERPNAAHDGLQALRLLARAVGTTTVLLPGHEQGDCYACTLAAESASNPVLARLLADEFDGQLPARDRLAAAPERISCDLSAADVREMAKTRPGLLVVDVRDAHEQRLGGAPSLGAGVTWQAVPLANLADALPDWLALPADQPVLFVCRSGQRSATAANALRRLGRDQSWSLAGGLAQWPKQGTPSEVSPEAPHLHD
ncbi:MAG: rhodanese-like domain-containing protein, partial [Pseudomonadota bacterium]|nr:rhodanese-like domain-containing protein [Pseudomonadota bacterium]